MKLSVTIHKEEYLCTPFCFACMAFAFACGFIMMFTDAGIYSPVKFLPFCYALMCLLSGPLFRRIKKSPVSLLIIGGYAIRMVIAPVLFAWGGYKSFYSVGLPSELYVKAAILLMIENIVVFVVASLCCSNNKDTYENGSSIVQLNSYNTRALAFIIICLIGFIVFAYAYVPAISSIYVFLPQVKISDLASIKWNNETIVARGTIARYVYSLFMFLWPIVRCILPAMMISHFRKKYGNGKIGLFLSVLCLFLPSILLGADNIAPFLGFFLGTLVIIRLYGSRSKRAISAVFILFGIAFVMIFTAKVLSYTAWRGAKGITSIAQILNAYFPGFENTAITLSIERDNLLNTLFYDLYYAIPFKETLFGLNGTNLSNLFTNASMTGGQIVPWGAQIAHYTGIALSPIITGLFVVIAYRQEKRSKLTESFWKYYASLYTSIAISMAFTVYSFSIFFRGYVNVIIPLLIIIAIGNKRKIKIAKDSF